MKGKKNRKVVESLVLSLAVASSVGSEMKSAGGKGCQVRGRVTKESALAVLDESDEPTWKDAVLAVLHDADEATWNAVRTKV